MNIAKNARVQANIVKSYISIIRPVVHLHVNIQNQSLKKILKSLFQVFFILICQNYKWIYQAFQGNISYK